MTLAADEFICRFLIHTQPPGFRRIRYCGFLASRHKKKKVALCRSLRAPAGELLPEQAECRQVAKAFDSANSPFIRAKAEAHRRRFPRPRDSDPYPKRIIPKRTTANYLRFSSSHGFITRRAARTTAPDVFVARPADETFFSDNYFAQ